MGENKSVLVANALFDSGCVKFGSFKLKSGLTSPYYLDLRVLISYPRNLKIVAHAMVMETVFRKIDFHRITAVPFAGLPIALAMSLEMERPMIFPRMEVKDHGTGRRIEGDFLPGERILLVDDLITTGLSKREVAGVLKETLLYVEDFLVVLDREQGGVEELADCGYRVHYLLTITRLVEILHDLGKITTNQLSEVMEYTKVSAKH